MASSEINGFSNVDDIWLEMNSGATKNKNKNKASIRTIEKKKSEKQQNLQNCGSIDNFHGLNDYLNNLNIKCNKSTENSLDSVLKISGCCGNSLVGTSGSKNGANKKDRKAKGKARMDCNVPVAPSQMVCSVMRNSPRKSSSRRAILDKEDMDKDSSNVLAIVTSHLEEQSFLTAKDLLPRLQRDIQCTDNEDVTVRRKALVRLYTCLFEREKDLDTEVYEDIFQEMAKPIFKRFGDPNEKCREVSLRLATEFLRRCRDLVPYLPYLFPAVMHRLPQDAAYDSELMVFVHNLEEHEEFKRGKAVYRQDKDLWNTSHKVVEMSEEVRLLVVQLMSVLTGKVVERKASSILHPYFHELVMFFSLQLRDPFPEVKIECCRSLTLLAQTPSFELGMKFYSMGIARSGLPLFRHRLAKVKVAAIEMVDHVVKVPNRDKCKGSATEVIPEMVGFRDDNVIQTADFYRPGVMVNVLAEVCQDLNAGVRLATATLLVDWLTTLPDKYDYEGKLVPYLLNFIHDSVEDIQRIAIDGIALCGKQYEEFHPEDVVEKRQYGVDGDLRCNYKKSLPPPFTDRPRIGTRLYIRGNTRRILKPLMEELCSWQSKTRLQSASLLRTIVIYCEEHLTVEVHFMLEYIYKAVSLARSERDHGLCDSLLESCELLGRFVLPSTYMPLILPKIKGDVTVTSVFGIDVEHKTAIFQVLGRFMEGTVSKELLPYMNKIFEIVTECGVADGGAIAAAAANSSSKTTLGLWEVGLIALNVLLEKLQGRGKDAINANFMQTGRLMVSIDSMMASAFRHLVVCQGMAAAAGSYSTTSASKNTRLLSELSQKGLQLLTGVEIKGGGDQLFVFQRYGPIVFAETICKLPLDTMWDPMCYEQIVVSELLRHLASSDVITDILKSYNEKVLRKLLVSIDCFKDHKQFREIISYNLSLIIAICKECTRGDIEVVSKIADSETNSKSNGIEDSNSNSNGDSISTNRIDSRRLLRPVCPLLLRDFLLPIDDAAIIAWGVGDVKEIHFQCLCALVLPQIENDTWESGFLAPDDIRDSCGEILAPKIAEILGDGTLLKQYRVLALKMATQVLHFVRTEGRLKSFSKQKNKNSESSRIIARVLYSVVLDKLDDNSEDVRLECINSLHEILYFLNEGTLTKDQESKSIELEYLNFLRTCFSQIWCDSLSDPFKDELETLMRSAAVLNPVKFLDEVNKNLEKTKPGDTETKNARQFFSTVSEHAEVLKMFSG